MNAEPTVFVVDDDVDMRDSLKFLMRSAGLRVQTFSSANAFVEAFDPRAPGCLVLDVRMPVMSGIELFERLTVLHSTLPVIFMTAHADVPTAVRALKSGAAEFLEKPFDRKSLLDRVQSAIREDSQRREQSLRWEGMAARMASLTAREREILDLLLAGSSNKLMAAQLSITERAVEMRRASILKKLNVASLAEMVRLATEFELATEGGKIPAGG